MYLEQILKSYKENKIKFEESLELIKSLGYISVSDICKLDLYREKRIGVLEAVLAEGKTTSDLLQIAETYINQKGRILITRANVNQIKTLKKKFKDKCLKIGKYSGTIVIFKKGSTIKKTGGLVALITAGTTDLNVIEEAKMTVNELGCETIDIYDVGVAGYQRLILQMDKLSTFNPDVIIVAAGREGALATLISSLIDVPVIGLPTSSGYGFCGNGISSLISMLQSCSILSVVNIDAGFIAGCNAAKIANKMALIRNQIKFTPK